MTPSQLLTQLRHIAAKISNSKFPRRDLVARDLKSLIIKLSTDDDISDREPDKTENGIKIWELDENHEIKLDNKGIKRWYKNDKIHREDGPAIEFPDGSKAWYKDGELHREDGPAIESRDGDKEWFKNNKRHREDGPAVELSDGSTEWWLNGKQVKSKDYSPDFSKNWERLVKSESHLGSTQDPDIPDRKPDEIDKYRNDIWYLGNGRKLIYNGHKFWYLNNKLHREDGPAVKYDDGTEHWYLNGKLHREDGPAIERTNGDKEWWLNDRRHREDGPAVEYLDGTKEWFLDGKQIKSKDYDSPRFQKRWQKLLEKEGIRQVMED